MEEAHPPGINARGDVRAGLRSLLASADAFNALEPETRKDIAHSLVKIGSTALDLAEEAETASTPPPVLASAQSRQPFGAATDRLARTTRETLEAVSFPRFVSELITGVFKAMNDSNQQQLTSFVELIRNVAASTEGFADANIGLAGARAWLAERFPGSFRVAGAEDDDGFDNPEEMTPEERAEWQRERDAEQSLELLPGASFPSEEALRLAFGGAPGQSIPTGNPESLVPLARAALARNKQEMLATMVQMGLQRIVIDSGRLNASMRFHVDTSSVANDDRGSQFDMRNTVEAGARGGFGPWGAEAKVQNTIGYVTTERSQSSEEINTELDLDSGVELIFRTDHVPLDRLAGAGDRERIRVNALNPEAEAARVQQARSARAQRRQTERKARRDSLQSSLRTPTAPPRPTPINPPDPPQPGGAGGGGAGGGGAGDGAGAGGGGGAGAGAGGGAGGGAGAGGGVDAGGGAGGAGGGGAGAGDGAGGGAGAGAGDGAGGGADGGAGAGADGGAGGGAGAGAGGGGGAGGAGGAGADGGAGAGNG